MVNEPEEKQEEDDTFPVRLPRTLIALMDKFRKEHPEVAIVSRQEMARRAISEWLLMKKRELEGK